MKKRTRLLIILIVVAVCFVFLWPTITWYWLTPDQAKIEALGSKQDIKQIAEDKAIRDENELKALLLKDPKQMVPQSYQYLVKQAEWNKANTKITHLKAVNDPAIVKGSLADLFTGFIASTTDSDYTMRSAIEAVYRDKLLSLKDAQSRAIQLGLDLSGGMSITIAADLDSLPIMKDAGSNSTKRAQARTDAMNSASEIILSRIDKFGLSEPVIRRQGENQIYVEIPGLADPERMASIVNGAARLSFNIVDSAATQALMSYAASNGFRVDTADEDFLAKVNSGAIVIPSVNVQDVKAVGSYHKDKYDLDEFDGYSCIRRTPMLEGKDISNITVATSQDSNKPEVTFDISASVSSRFAEDTGKNINQPMAVVLDDRIKSIANIQTKITTLGVRIDGMGATEATSLSAILKTASIDVPLSIKSQNTIGASLGADAIQSGIFAVSIAFLLVIGFMLLYYKGAGINTMIAEVLNLYMMISVLSVFGLTLTLPSIAGFVLTIGVSVDANVLIFERIKEELRLGKGRAASIEAGFHKAFWTIFDSHLTNLIAAVFLAQLGNGPIGGFAISLAIGTISSLFTSLFVSRLLFDFETDVLKLRHTSISWRVK